MRRGFLGVDGWEERRRRDARWVILFSVSGLRQLALVHVCIEREKARGVVYIAGYGRTSVSESPSSSISSCPKAASRGFIAVVSLALALGSFGKSLAAITS